MSKEISIEEFNRQLTVPKETLPLKAGDLLAEIEVKEVFGHLLGCYVLSGTVINHSSKDTNMVVKREKEIVFEGKLDVLRRFEEDVAFVGHGYECGMSITGLKSPQVQIDDIIEQYFVE